MTEIPVLLGADGSLLGNLCQPTTPRSPDFALLMFNAGVLSRIGPHRVNVKLARALALRGVTSLRFDLSSQGDSRSAGTSGGEARSAVEDITVAMNHMQSQYAIERFAVLGVCSGAVHALSVSLVDPRIVGLMMIDGHWYRSRWTMLVRHWKRLRTLSVSGIGGVILRRLRRVRLPAVTQGDGLFDAPLVPANPPRDLFARSLQTLTDRGVATHFIYSGTVLDFYSYANQFRDTFGREPFFASVRCDFRPDIDHTFASLAAQSRLIELVGEWTRETERRLDSAAPSLDAYIPTRGS